MILFDFRLDPLRTAVEQRFGSNFFDLQAQAFLHGHIAVPTGSLGIEGFVVHGRTYMYFPPFPALLRIPIMLVTHEFDGRLTLLSMAGAWIVFATMTTKLYWLVRRCVRGAAQLTRTEAAFSAIFLAAATGGTVLVFDASLPWVYHEVYLWATALVIGALYWLIRVSLLPQRKSLWWLAGFTLAAILTRTTGGWAVCLAVIATGGWILTGRPHPDLRRLGWAVLAAGAVPLLVAASYNFVKFGHPYLFPLQDQVWTAVNQRRREALAHNGGTLTGPQFFLTSLVNYFRPRGIRIVDYFPYLTLPAHPAPAYGGAFLDQSYRTGSVTAFMPLLLALSVLGAVRVAWRGAAFEIRVLRLPLLGALAVTAGVMGYGYVTYRYTSEFLPFLVLGSAIGVSVLNEALARRRRRHVVKVSVLSVVSLATVFSIAANMATGAALAAQTWQGDKLTQFVALQQDLSAVTGHPLRSMITQSTALPQQGRTDELRIVGECAGLYLDTGDNSQPWIAVEQRERLARIRIGARATGNAMIPLFQVYGRDIRTIALQTQVSQRARFVVTYGSRTEPGLWFDVTPGLSVLLILRADTATDETVLYSTPGGIAGEVPLAEYGTDWISRISLVVPQPRDSTADSRRDVGVAYGWGPEPALCRSLAAERSRR
ncbi:MAG: hypothetical protein ACR2LF_04335 [Jatrophihabitantaceae bacterium]